MSFALMNDYWLFFMILVMAFFITYLSIPMIIKVARKKKLFDEPNGRTSHTNVTPTLGGMAVFAGFFITSMVFVNISKIPSIQYILAGAVIIFFLGLNDDIIGVSPLKKFIGQFIAAFLIIDLGNIHITNLHGLFGLFEINSVSGDFLTLVIVVGIINAINLIDGIDGLASGVSILAASVFGFWFYWVGDKQLALVSFALVGALLAFFRFNFFSTKQKLFLGDIGSLLLGFLLAVFVVLFNEKALSLPVSNPFYIRSAPAVSIGILIIPVFDTLRVMTVRMMKGISPFKPDKRHVHHYLLELTGSHKKATLIILSVNLFFIVFVACCSSMPGTLLLFIIFVLSSILSFVPIFMLRRKRKKHSVASQAFKADT